MSWQDTGIAEKHVATMLAATVRVTPGSRKELPAMLDELARPIPREVISGPPFCIIRFVSSISKGLDAEVGFPVRRALEPEGISTRRFPALDVLSLVHKGPLETLAETYRTLYGAAAKQGLISDEFACEVYPGWKAGNWHRVEVQFVLHDWAALFVKSLDDVLGPEARDRLIGEGPAPTVTSTLDERFRWVKAMMEQMDGLASEEETCDVVSHCAHVFPQEQVDKLRAVYEAAQVKSHDLLDAVDAVLRFMEEDPGWGSAPSREGRVLYATKAPRDAEGYANADTEAERRRAYCFCPIIRNRLHQGMPPTFCNCGAGWYRQQWEGAFGMPVRVEIVKSLLRGDDVCQFGIQLPRDL